MTRFGAIWAQSTDGVIGDGTTMPWHVPEDLAHFKDITGAHPVIMGRGTWRSLPERFRPLPGRTNFVLSSLEPDTWSEGAYVITDIPDFPPDTEPWIIGGGQVYASTMDLVDIVEITLIDAAIAPYLGSLAVVAPAVRGEFELVSDSGWQVSEKGKLLVGPDSERAPVKYRFLTYERKVVS